MPKYCKCKKSRALCIDGGIICSRCWKPIQIKIRKLWVRNPYTLIKKSDKIYNRKKAKKEIGRKIKKGGIK